MASSTLSSTRRRPVHSLAVLFREPGEGSPWMPNARIVVRLLLIARIIAALNANISDCDETYNYWEPLHLLTNTPRPLGTSQSPFQTWEYAPRFAIRSWAYLLQYVPVAKAVRFILQKREKSAAFYAIRIALAVTSTLCEARFIRSIADFVHPRIARYTLVLLVFSVGMYDSSAALLPSSFVMYTTTLAWSFALAPSTDASKQFPVNTSVVASTATKNAQNSLFATLVFALGALLGWPFALVLSFPFVFEHLFLPSGLLVPVNRYLQFLWHRLRTWSACVIVAALIALPIFTIDTLAYGIPSLVPLNIITYNVLSAKRGAGPTLYGVEPWYFYLLNLLLKFGPSILFALVSLPAALLLSLTSPERLAWRSSTTDSVKDAAAKKDRQTSTLASSPLLLLVLRLAPVYLWLGLLTLQAHKEERFVYPAYPLICFNAATGLYCVRALASRLLDENKAAPSGNGRSRQTWSFAKVFTLVILLSTSVFSVARIVHSTTSFRAPFTVLSYLNDHELPRIVAHTFPERQAKDVQARLKAGLAPVLTLTELEQRSWTEDKKHDPYVSLDALVELAPRRANDVDALRLCYGKEWYRFPSTYLVPDGVTVDFIKSDFSGILPKHFVRPQSKDATRSKPKQSPHSVVRRLDSVLSFAWPWTYTTRAHQAGFNDMNMEESDQYVDVSTCDYLVDVDWPHLYEGDKRASTTGHEPRFALDERKWTRLFCAPFLDAVHSRAPVGSRLTAKVRATIDRTLWLPAFARGQTSKYGDYCLLRTTQRDSVANVGLA